MKHNKLVKMISSKLMERGLVVENELPLPFGKGATDISCSLNNKYLFHAEIKESPSTINQKGVRKQLEKYEGFFGKGPDYILISPGSSEIIVQNLSGKKLNLNDYFSNLK